MADSSPARRLRCCSTEAVALVDGDDTGSGEFFRAVLHAPNVFGVIEPGSSSERRGTGTQLVNAASERRDVRTQCRKEAEAGLARIVDAVPIDIER